MRYTVLDKDEQDDTIVQFLQSQERDHFIHTLNESRYRDMLPSLPAGEFKDRIQALLDSTVERRQEVETIIQSTLSQMPVQADIAISIARIKGRNRPPQA